MIYWDLQSADALGLSPSGDPPEGLLSAPEQVFLQRLHVPKRRREWVLGRAAAKALLCRWLAANGRPALPSALTVAPAPDGSPYALLGSDRLPVTVSLSHREGHALCALVERPEAPLGADLEVCESRSPGWLEDFFTSGEVHSVEIARDPRRAATQIWSLKEAALKATRLGLTVDTRRVTATPRGGPATGWGRAALVLRLEGKPARGTAFVRDAARFVAAVAWLGAEPMGEPSEALRGPAPWLQAARAA